MRAAKAVRHHIRILLAAITVVLAALLIHQVALAHAVLVRSEPAANAVLTEPPQEVRLWFSEAISPEFSTARLLDANGQPIEPLAIRVDAAENRMSLSLPVLAEGVYSVNWRVLSEADGHFTEGFIVFRIGGGESAVSPSPAPREAAPPLPEVLLRWLNFTALAALIGALAMVHLVLGQGVGTASLEAVRDTARRRMLRWAALSGALALALGIGLLIWQITLLATGLPEGASLQRAMWLLLTRTRWGLLWSARQVILLALTGAAYLLTHQAQQGKQGTGIFGAAGALSLSLMAIQAMMGHAAAVTPSTALAIAADALHLLAASLWMGGLLTLTLGLLPLLLREKKDFIVWMRATWGPFSRYAALSVGMLVASGLYNTARQVASLDALISTIYGRALLIKVGMVLAAGLCGLLNAVLLHPTLIAPLGRLLRRPTAWMPLPPARFPLLVAAEATLGLLVMLTVGHITASPPARGPQFAPPPDEIPTSLSQTVDDLLITFSAQPNQPGQNLFTVRAVSTRRPPPAEIMRVIVRFTYLDEEIGRASADAEPVEAGVYRLSGDYLSLAGRWQVEVVVRRAGLPDSAARFDWYVVAPGMTRPVILSNRPWGPLLSAIGAALAAVTVLAAAVLWWRRRFLVAAGRENADEPSVMRPERAAGEG